MNAIGLSQHTYDRFSRVAAAVEGKIPGSPFSVGQPSEGHALLRVTSSTIGTYGYPAKVQEFDESDGSFVDSEAIPETVYLVDPTDAVLRVDERYDAKFVGFRGAAGEAVYEAVNPTANIADAGYDVPGIVNTSDQYLGEGNKYVRTIRATTSISGIAGAGNHTEYGEDVSYVGTLAFAERGNPSTFTFGITANALTWNTGAASYTGLAGYARSGTYYIGGVAVLDNGPCTLTSVAVAADGGRITVFGSASL